MSREKYTINIYNEMKKFCNLRKDGKVHACFLNINDFGPCAGYVSLADDTKSNYLDEILVLMQNEGYEIIDIKMVCNPNVMNSLSNGVSKSDKFETPGIYMSNSDVSQYTFCIIYK